MTFYITADQTEFGVVLHLQMILLYVHLYYRKICVKIIRMCQVK